MFPQPQPEKEGQPPTPRRTPIPHPRGQMKCQTHTREGKGTPHRKKDGPNPRRANIPPLEGVANLNKKKEGRIHTRRAQPQEGRAKRTPRTMGRPTTNHEKEEQNTKIFMIIKLKLKITIVMTFLKIHIKNQNFHDNN